MQLWDTRLIRMTVAGVVAGVMIGVVGGAFRWCLERAEHLRDWMIAASHGRPYVGWVVPVIVAAVAVALARYLVLRFAPEAAGSGVHRVEAIMAGEIKSGSDAILPVKFFGGVLSLGSGMALGREGPTVQMGASLAHIIAPWLVRDEADQRVVLAAGAGAGLAVAFNAPIGGSVFVFEELTTSFTPWLLVATLAAATCAVWTMRLILGNHPDFVVRQVSLTAAWNGWPFVVMGMMLGVVGAFYNSSVIGLLRVCDRL